MKEMIMIKYYIKIIFFEQMNFKLLFSFIAFLLPLKFLFLTILAVLLLDLITGVWKSLKNKEKITSVGLYKTNIKLTLYSLLMFVIYMFEKYILCFSTIYVTTYAVGFIIIAELYSAIENVADITGNKNVLNIKDFIQNIFNKNKDKSNG